jgi:hypothetical protein
LHREAFTHRSSYAEKLLDRANFTQSKVLHTQKLVRREAFTQSQLLHNEFLTYMAAEIAASKPDLDAKPEKRV